MFFVMMCRNLMPKSYIVLIKERRKLWYDRIFDTIYFVENSMPEEKKLKGIYEDEGMCVYVMTVLIVDGMMMMGIGYEYRLCFRKLLSVERNIFHIFELSCQLFLPWQGEWHVRTIYSNHQLNILWKYFFRFVRSDSLERRYFPTEYDLEDKGFGQSYTSQTIHIHSTQKT